MLEPEVEARPWDEQLALDDAAYREQLAYLFERSAFYREKLRRPGSPRPTTPAASRRSRELPLTEKAELRATAHAGEPVRRASLRDARRDRPDLLDERHDRDAELHPADRGRPRELGDGLGAELRRLGHRGRRSGSSRPTTPGRSWRARRSRVRPHRPLPHPGRHRQHRAADARDRAAAARGGGADAVLRRLPRRVGGGARLRPRGLERRARARRGRAGRRRAGASARSSRTAGARASPRRWASATSASRSGASASSRTACISARAASCTPSWSIPRRARRVATRGRRERRARAHAPPAPRRAAAALPHARPRRRCGRRRAPAAAPARACAASGAPTTC